MSKTYYIKDKEIGNLKTIEEVDYWLNRYAKYDNSYWLKRKYVSENNKERHRKWREDTVKKLQKRRREIK